MSVEAGARWYARISMKCPTVPISPMRHSSAHHCHPGSACQKKGRAQAAIKAPTQPV